jgi:beta-glucosidase
LLKTVAATNKRVVIVLQNESTLAVDWAQEHANAILEVWYACEKGETAIAEIIDGDNNPGPPSVDLLLFSPRVSFLMTTP